MLNYSGLDKPLATYPDSPYTPNHGTRVRQPRALLYVSPKDAMRVPDEPLSSSPFSIPTQGMMTYGSKPKYPHPVEGV